MPDPSNPIEPLLDVLLYLPIGVATAIRDALPELVEKGRAQMAETEQAVTNQVALLRSVAQAGIRLLGRRGSTGGSRGADEPSPTEAPAPPPPTAGQPSGSDAIRAAQSRAGRAMQEAAGARAAAEAGSAADGALATANAEATAEHRASVAAASAAAELLAIPDYESLSAAQVNARLGALTPPELDAVRQYEESHRNRRTVLARIEALDASGASPG